MALIPKIKLTSGRKREKVSLLTDSQTTANFGFVQPTFCREMIPNSKFSVKVNSRVLNAPMPVPTYGRMELEHRHVYVPYIDVCPQFDSFLAAQSYKPGSGIAYVPNTLVPFYSSLIAQYILGRYADWSVYVKYYNNTPVETIEPEKIPYGYEPILLDGSKMDNDKLDFVRGIYNRIFHSSEDSFFYGKKLNSDQLGVARQLMPNGHIISDATRGTADDRVFGNWLLGGWQYVGDNTIDGSASTFSYKYNSNPLGLFEGNASNAYVTLEDADFISKFGGDSANDWDLVIAFKLRPRAKAFRSILLGLGYQFTPNLFGKVDNCNWLKLLAYYKAWFNLYRPKRELSFTNTTCYNLIKLFESSTATTDLFPLTSGMNLSMSSDVAKFLDSLALACQYYLPQDYFGMAVLTPNQNFMGSGSSISSGTKGLASSGAVSDTADIINMSNNESQAQVYLSQYNTREISANAINMALKILKYVNKNTIVGRSIHDYIKAHFGVSVDNSHDLESVFEIGRENIYIDTQVVTSTASTETDELGSYAARGFGYNNNAKRFEFECKDSFGVWITLSTIIPKSGYYQGILRENMALKRYDFFTPEFDALGYDVILRDELSADYPTQVSLFNQVTDSSFDLKKAFGFVPRYSHYKVGRNIVSGDLSLRGYRNQYEGYYLDRKIPYERLLPQWFRLNNDNVLYNTLNKPAYIPGVVFDNFRRIDPNDNLGNYNRIFYSTSVLDDHFIISSTFDVDAWLPAKSLSESFDTLTDEDGKVIDITHS